MKPITVELDGSEKGLHPCKACGSYRALATPGKGPHAKRLDCSECGRFHGWLSLTTGIAMGMFERVQ